MITVRVGDRAHGVGPGWLTWVREGREHGAPVQVRVARPGGEVRFEAGRPAAGEWMVAEWCALGLDRPEWELGALARFVSVLDGPG